MKKMLFVLPVLLVVLTLFAGSFSFVFANSTLQADVTTGLTNVGTAAGYDPTTADVTTLPATIGRLVKIALGFLGVIMVVIVIYAGFLWMTAGGETDQVKKAKDWILNATIGLLIVVAAYSITGFVIAKVFEATAGTP